MRKFNLKNGLEAKIDIWNFQDLESFASRDLPTWKPYEHNDHTAFSGFTFLSPKVTENLGMSDRDNDYSRADNLTRLEIQTKRNLAREDYHRAIVATVDDEPIGIALFQWAKFFKNYWSYFFKWIDIHKDYKNQGVGTELIRTLDDSEFIKGKILRLGWFTDEGLSYISGVVKRDLKARDYALVFDEYVGPTPNSFGIYE